MHGNHLETSEINFLHQIKKELSLETNNEIINKIVSILQALRQTLDNENANTLMKELPDFLKLAFAGNWESNEKIVSINHLDEFVNLVQTRDIKSGSFYFSDEVQILSLSILTLKKLFEFEKLKNFAGLSPCIRQQLSEVSVEEIAA